MIAVLRDSLPLSDVYKNMLQLRGIEKETRYSCRCDQRASEMLQYGSIEHETTTVAYTEASVRASMGSAALLDDVGRLCSSNNGCKSNQMSDSVRGLEYVRTFSAIPYTVALRWALS